MNGTNESDRFRCIHCNRICPRQRASVVPFPATLNNPLPIGVCDRLTCQEEHRTVTSPAQSRPIRWREKPRTHWGTCLHCRGTVWQLDDGSLWACAKCSSQWFDPPPADEAERALT